MKFYFEVDNKKTDEYKITKYIRTIHPDISCDAKGYYIIKNINGIKNQIWINTEVYNKNEGNRLLIIDFCLEWIEKTKKQLIYNYNNNKYMKSVIYPNSPSNPTFINI